MKFNHKFSLADFGKSFRAYKCDNVNARIDFLADTCIRVSVYKDKEDMLPTFCVNPNNSAFNPMGRDRLDVSGFDLVEPKISANDSIEEIIINDTLKVTINLENFIIKYYQNDEVIFNDREPLAYNFENEFGAESYHYISRANDEKIFGLGDKGGELNKAGGSYRIETTDCMGYDAHSTDPMYKHVPFYICENNVGAYGIFYDTSDTSYFDLGKEVNNYYLPYKYFKTNDNCLVYYVFFGSKLEILQQFCKLVGKQAFPPRWSFDYCASTMAYTDAEKSEDKMNDFLQKVKDLDLNCKGFYLSSGYTSIGPQRYVFNWNYDKFPNPKAFINNFSSNGIEIIPNIKPAFLTDHPMYEELKDRGLFVKNPDGTPFLTQFWDGCGSYLDFTNIEAFAFWQQQVKEKLLDNGIIATWNDNNEFDIKDNVATAVGFGKKVLASRIRPVLTYLMVESSYQAQMAQNPNLRPFLSTRSGNIAVRRLAQTWSGDNRTHFDDLRYCHYIGLTMSMSGMYFYGHDLGGFSGNMPSRELLLRWLQHGLFEPRFTIHSWNADGSATMPWSYDDIMESVKAIFDQRKKLVPYFYNCAYNAVEKEEPINAPLFMYYDDENISLDTNSFMLGRNILATCVFDEGVEKVNAYLPKGDSWYLNDKLYEGGQLVELTIPAQSSMPYFVKAGSVVPYNEAASGFNDNEDIVLTVYPKENESFNAEFFWDDGLSFEYKNNNCVKLDIKVTSDNDTVTVRYKNLGNMHYEPKFKLNICDKKLVVIEE